MIRLKRHFSFILICVSLICYSLLTGCGSKENTFDENVGKKIICTSSDFEKVKNDWHGENSLISEKALSTHTENLIVGEKYYFVYTFFLDYDGEYSGNKSDLNYNLDFTLKSWGNLPVTNSGAATVHTSETVVGENLSYSDGLGFYLNLLSLPETGDILSFIAIPFTPNDSGIMYIDSALSNYYRKYVPLNDASSRICANVFTDKESMNVSADIEISNLSYKLISENDYVNGNFDNGELSSSVYQLSEGRNYFVIDYDITAKSAYGNEIYSGIFVRKGIWSDATLEHANTSKISRLDTDDGEVFDFAYNTPTDGAKKIRTVFSFYAPDLSVIDFEIFIYGSNVRVSGETYASGSFYDKNASELTFRVDAESFECYVSGYKTMTGNVIVPTYYQGYPVAGIDKDAFKNCTELKSVNLNSVRFINDSAFEGCTNLEYVSLGTRLEKIGMKAFLNSGITKIHIPFSTTSIGYQSFKGCDKLKDITLDNEVGWYRQERDTKHHCPYVSSRLTNDYTEYNLILVSSVEAERFRIGFVKKDEYEARDSEDDITYVKTVPWMERQLYYFALEFDCTFLTEIDPKMLYVNLENVSFYDFELIELIGDDFTYKTSSYPDHKIYNVELVYHGDLNEKSRLRLVFDGTLSSNCTLNGSLTGSIVNGIEDFNFKQDLMIDY